MLMVLVTFSPGKGMPTLASASYSMSVIETTVQIVNLTKIVLKM